MLAATRSALRPTTHTRRRARGSAAALADGGNRSWPGDIGVRAGMGAERDGAGACAADLQRLDAGNGGEGLAIETRPEVGLSAICTRPEWPKRKD